MKKQRWVATREFFGQTFYLGEQLDKSGVCTYAHREQAYVFQSVYEAVAFASDHQGDWTIRPTRERSVKPDRNLTG